MKLHCPHCGVKGSADDSYSGRKVTCPKCQGIFEVSPDLALELPEDAPLSSPLPSTSVESSPTSEEVEAPITVDEGFNEEEVDDALPASEIEPVEELVETDDDLVDPEPEITLPVEEFAEEEEESIDWEDIASDIDLELAQAEQEENLDRSNPAEISSFQDEFENPAEEEVPLVEKTDEIELEPYGIDKKQCWQCGKSETVEEFIAKDGRLYCSDCAPLIGLEESADIPHALDEGDTLAVSDLGDENIDWPDGLDRRFSIGGAIRKAWAKTKGAKGAIWAGSAIMYLVILVIVAGGSFLLPSLNSGMSVVNGIVINALLQSVTSIVSVLFTAGLLLMGIRKVAGERISWKMIFKGFSCSGKIIVASILQFILVVIGFLLLVLPGIYLAVGYAMTIPLIIDKGLSPWQAMEMSRKAIHKVWWKVAGLFIVMGLIYIVSLVPLGIGLIWTWPMFIILSGVVYQHLFGDENNAD